MADPAAQPILNFDALCNDDQWVMAVPDRSWETIQRAVQVIVDQSCEIGFYDWQDYFTDDLPWWVLARIAMAGDFGKLRLHQTPPWSDNDGNGCDNHCQDEGWWCTDASGPEWEFFFVDRSVVAAVEEDLCKRMWVLDEEYC